MRESTKICKYLFYIMDIDSECAEYAKDTGDIFHIVLSF